jgi:hypothetical protein
MFPRSSFQPEDGNSYSCPCRYQHGKSESRIVPAAIPGLTHICRRACEWFRAGNVNDSPTLSAAYAAAILVLVYRELPLDNPLLPAPFSSFHSWYTFHMDEQWAKESNLTRILGWTGAVHALALICVCLRMYARLRILRTPGRDDAAIVVASVSPI